MRLRNVFLIAIVFCANLCCGAEEKKQYSYKFEVGQQYHVKHILQRKVEPKGDRNEGITVEQKFSFDYGVLVKEVGDDGGAWLEFRYDGISIEQKDFEKQVSYDSAKDGDNISPLLWGYKAMLGEVFQVKISRLGEIEQVKGFIEVHQSVKEKIKPNPGKKMQVRQIQSQFNDVLLRELLMNLTDIYTDKKVGKGDSWNKSFDVSYDAQLEFNNKFKLNDVTDDGFAVIGLETKIRTKFGAKPVTNGSMKLKSKSSGSQSGIIRVNESTGEIISSDINQKITTVTEVISSDAQTPRSNNVEVESSIHFEFKKIDEPKVEVENKQPDL